MGNNFTDTMSAWSTTTLSVVNNTFEKFEGFSQILKEQSGDKRYLGVLTNPIEII